MPTTPTQTYWNNRAQQNSNRAYRLALTYGKRLKKLYQAARDSCENQLNAALAEILAGGKPPTRTALYRYEKYRELESLIDRELGVLRSRQVSMIDAMVDSIFQSTIGTTYQQMTGKDAAFNFVPERATSELVNFEWSGKNYSQRVWQNVNALASHLKSDLMEQIMLGRNPADIKRKLADDMNVGFSSADRIIRTESMYVYNRAAMAGYQASGIKQVRVLIAHDERLCDKCEGHAGVYDIGSEPLLPRHPNCRCCYAPVVDLSVQGILDKAKSMAAAKRP